MGFNFSRLDNSEIDTLVSTGVILALSQALLPKERPGTHGVPGPAQLSVAVQKSRRGPDIFSRVIDIKNGRKGFNCVGALCPEQQNKAKYQVNYRTYLASGRQMSYTPSVERVVE